MNERDRAAILMLWVTGRKSLRYIYYLYPQYSKGEIKDLIGTLKRTPTPHSRLEYIHD